MKNKNWQKVKQIFSDALEVEHSERESFLENACAGDGDLRREVDVLLHSFEEGFLEKPAVGQVAEAIIEKQDPVEVGEQINHYEILERLGVGGQGSVFLARDQKLNRRVALKFLPPETLLDRHAIRRFRREAESAAALSHPNICAIHEIVETEGRAFLAMQYVEGETLSERLKNGRLEVSTALRFAIQIASALTDAHAQGVIHRDIKPANIIVSATEQLRILDFGLAKRIVAKDEKQSFETQTGAIMGTAAYMSPEQARGQTVDERTDIWSLGVVLYEMLAGKQPFARESLADTLAAIVSAEPDLAEIPPQAAEIVSKALQKERDKRYEKAADMLADLQRIRDELSFEKLQRERFPAGVEPKKYSRKSPGFVAAALVLIVAVVFGVSYFFSNKEEKPPVQRKLTRLTFEPGLQSEPSWSPDGRFIAYYSDQSGNFDIWVQQASGGNPVQATKSPAHDWQPDFSPDGNNIVFRSEREGGGLFVMQAFGGGERKISSVGYHPRWSSDGKNILFFNTNLNGAVTVPRVYVIAPDGKGAREVWQEASGEYVGFMRADWHPDGKRVSFIGQRRQGGLSFWTVPVDGGQAVKSEISVEVEKQINETGVGFYDFAWAASGAALYLEGDTNGVKNLWRVAVEPKTLRWTGNLERLTTGAGRDTDISISPDGARLAFTTQSYQTRVWSVPLDASKNQIKSEGQPLSPAGMDTGEFSLSRDGKKLVFVARRAGKIELWEKSLADGKERLLLTAADEDVFSSPRFSPDAARVAFARNHNPEPERRKFIQTFEKSISVLPVDGGGEQSLTTPNIFQGWAWDWSPDGQFILGSSAVNTSNPEHWGLYLFPLAAAPRAEAQQKLIIDDPRYNFWQGRFSPDGKWILFLAAGVTDSTDSFLGIIPRDGGAVTRIPWDDSGDKPRWSPDGKTIYFYSNRTGFRNVWGINFDTVGAKPVGEPFRLTNFESPGKMLIASPLLGQHAAMLTDLAVGSDQLIVNVTQVSGGVWILDNVDK